MTTVPLTTAIATYGYTQALKDGSITTPRVALEHLDVSPITTAFRRMVRSLAYDVSEMALSTYLCARAYDKPMTALPIFVLRRFEHASIVYNVKSGITSPADLHGRRVGMRSYTLTPGVWVRGILQSTYGVEPSKVQWVLFGDEHVAEYVAPSYATPAPAGQDIVAALLAGEIDAAIGVRGVDAPEIQPLIPTPRQAAIQYFQQTGIYPISHLLVVKDAVLHEHPWVAEELWRLFIDAKDAYLTQLRSGAATDTAMQAMRDAIGDDPLLYGVAPNRRTLEAFIQFNVTQQIIPRPVEVDDLFPRSLLSCV